MKKVLIAIIMIFAITTTSSVQARDMKDDTDYCAILKQIENYRNKIKECDEKGYHTSCYDDLATEIIKEYYSIYPEENLKAYKNFVQAVHDAYGVVYCQNKFKWPAGQICDNLSYGASLKLIKQYILDLLQSVEDVIKEYYTN